MGSPVTPLTLYMMAAKKPHENDDAAFQEAECARIITIALSRHIANGQVAAGHEAATHAGANFATSPTMTEQQQVSNKHHVLPSDPASIDAKPPNVNSAVSPTQDDKCREQQPLGIQQDREVSIGASLPCQGGSARDTPPVVEKGTFKPNIPVNKIHIDTSVASQIASNGDGAVIGFKEQISNKSTIIDVHPPINPVTKEVVTGLNVSLKFNPLTDITPKVNPTINSVVVPSTPSRDSPSSSLFDAAHRDNSATIVPSRLNNSVSIVPSRPNAKSPGSNLVNAAHNDNSVNIVPSRPSAKRPGSNLLNTAPEDNSVNTVPSRPSAKSLGSNLLNAAPQKNPIIDVVVVPSRPNENSPGSNLLNVAPKDNIAPVPSPIPQIVPIDALPGPSELQSKTVPRANYISKIQDVPTIPLGVQPIITTKLSTTDATRSNIAPGQQDNPIILNDDGDDESVEQQHIHFPPDPVNTAVTRHAENIHPVNGVVTAKKTASIASMPTEQSCRNEPKMSSLAEDILDSYFPKDDQMPSAKLWAKRTAERLESLIEKASRMNPEQRAIVEASVLRNLPTRIVRARKVRIWAAEARVRTDNVFKAQAQAARAKALTIENIHVKELRQQIQRNQVPPASSNQFDRQFQSHPIMQQPLPFTNLQRMHRPPGKVPVPRFAHASVHYPATAQPPNRKILSIYTFFVSPIHSPVHSVLLQEQNSSSNLSSKDDSFLTLLEVFQFGKRPRTSDFEPEYTPVAAAFRNVFLSTNPSLTQATTGICCRGCRHELMTRRTTTCSAMAVAFPTGPDSFLQSLLNFKKHVLECTSISWKDRNYINGIIQKPGIFTGAWGLPDFVKWHFQKLPTLFALTNEQKAEAEREKQELLEDLHQDLQDAVAGGFKNGQQGHFAFLLESLLDIPFSTQYPDTPGSLVILDCFELVMIRRDRAIKCFKEEVAALSFDSVAIIQCKYCHGKDNCGARNNSAILHADGEGSSDMFDLTMGVISLFYKHARVCSMAPMEALRKSHDMQPMPRSVQFNTAMQSLSRRMEDLNTFLRKAHKQSPSQQDQEIWVAPSPKELCDIYRRYGSDTFFKVSQPMTNGDAGSKVLEEVEFPRVGRLHGEVCAEPSTKCRLSRFKRAIWPNLGAKVQEEEDLQENIVVRIASQTSNKKLKLG